jgi:hypothetical protein
MAANKFKAEQAEQAEQSIEQRVATLEKRMTQFEAERMCSVNNQFEIWVDNKLRGSAYGPDLKKIVMPQSIGKPIEECRKIFFGERDRLVKERYPGQPTPGWM